MPFSSTSVNQTKFQKLCEDLNDFLKKARTKNIILIDIDKPFFQLGLSNVIDWRGFYSTKSLYKTAFFQSYADFISPYFLAISAKSKKVLVFDCDNTLWKGVIGEDGMEGIDMSPTSKSGKFYHLVQRIAVFLSKRGVIVGLCSKNNEQDVLDALRNHKDMILKEDHIVIKKINWENKADNLRAIASELNIGIDSLVFVDDSNFEINLIKLLLLHNNTSKEFK